jgi:hypothetical protein
MLKKMNSQVEPVSDVEAEESSYESVVSSINAFLALRPSVSPKPPEPMPPTFTMLYPLIRPYEKEFQEKFPKCKLGAPVSRWVMATAKVPAHYLVKIPFVWSQYDIPRFGILAFTVKQSFYKTWDVEFNPFLSEPTRDKVQGIDWTMLYYVDSFAPLRSLERIISSAVVANPPLEVADLSGNSQANSQALLEQHH